MAQRAPSVQMPPLATEHVDPDGLARVRAWIAALPAPCPGRVRFSRRRAMFATLGGTGHGDRSPRRVGS
jgi:hypothetical protein